MSNQFNLKILIVIVSILIIASALFGAFLILKDKLFHLTVSIKQNIEVPIDETINVNTSIPLNIVIPINTTVNATFEIPLVGQVTVPIPIQANIPVSLNIPINNLPIEIKDTFNINLDESINTKIKLDL